MITCKIYIKDSIYPIYSGLVNIPRAPGATEFIPVNGFTENHKLSGVCPDSLTNAIEVHFINQLTSEQLNTINHANGCNDKIDIELIGEFDKLYEFISFDPANICATKLVAKYDW